MGPPTAVPLRDVSRVMILLRSLFFNPSLPHPSGPNFWQGFKSSWRHGRSIEPCISKQDQQKKRKEREKRERERATGTRGRGGTRRGALRGRSRDVRPGLLPGTPWLSDLWLPPASMQQDVRPSPPSTPPPPATSPLTSHPRRMEGGGGFPDADLRLPPLPTPTKLASSLRLPDASPPFDASAWTHERHICCSSDEPARGGADGVGCAASAEGL